MDTTTNTTSSNIRLDEVTAALMDLAPAVSEFVALPEADWDKVRDLVKRFVPVAVIDAELSSSPGVARLVIDLPGGE